MKKLVSYASVLIFSLMLAGTSLAQPYHGMGNFDGPGFHGFRAQWAEKLNLTEDQKSAIEDLRIQHQKKMVDLKAGLEKRMLDLKELKSKGNYTRDDYLAKVKAITEAKDAIALSMANHRMDIYELLNADQQKTFNALTNDMGRKMMGKMKHKRMKMMMK